MDVSRSPYPPQPQCDIDAAAADVPAVFAHHGKIESSGDSLAVALRDQRGHSLFAADQAIRRLVVDGLLIASQRLVYGPTVYDSNGKCVVECVPTPAPMPTDGPTALSKLTVKATDGLWVWFRENANKTPSVKQVHTQPGADNADRKTDKQKKLPRDSEVMKAAKHVRKQQSRMNNGEIPVESLGDILIDFTDGDSQRAQSLGRQLRPDRYGHLLEPSADK